MRLAAGVVEVAAEVVAAREPLEAVQEAEQTRRDRKAVLGELDGRREEIRPRQAAVLAMRELEHAQRARHADGETADADVRERLWPPVRAEEHVGRRGRGSRLAPFVRRDGAGVAVIRCGIDEHERAAADTRGLRLDERQDELHCDRGVDGAAAGAQDAPARFRRVRIRRHDELRLGAHWGGGLRRCAAERSRGERRKEDVTQRHRPRLWHQGFPSFCLRRSATTG